MPGGVQWRGRGAVLGFGVWCGGDPVMWGGTGRERGRSREGRDLDGCLLCAEGTGGLVHRVMTDASPELAPRLGCTDRAAWAQAAQDCVFQSAQDCVVPVSTGMCGSSQLTCSAQPGTTYLLAKRERPGAVSCSSTSWKASVMASWVACCSLPPGARYTWSGMESVHLPREEGQERGGEGGEEGVCCEAG